MPANPSSSRLAASALLLVFLLVAPSAADADAGTGPASAANKTAAACGTTIAAPCCPPAGPPDTATGLSAWTCSATAGADTIPLVCLDDSENAGVTACYPMPKASASAACGANGQPCCPPNYHRHTSAVLPASCDDGFCEPMVGATPCSTAGPLSPCGTCTPNPPGCGAAVGAPCCVYSINGPSDTYTCGSQKPSDLGSETGLVPGAGGLTCDFTAVGGKRLCVAAGSAAGQASMG